MRTMGLARVADTKVGNALVRGVSGGERKRVTSAEMLVGPKVCALPLNLTRRSRDASDNQWRASARSGRAASAQQTR